MDLWRTKPQKNVFTLLHLSFVNSPFVYKGYYIILFIGQCTLSLKNAYWTYILYIFVELLHSLYEVFNFR